MEVVIFGPPGSGKGTYSSRLEDRLGVKHVATGDIYREHIKKGTEIGEKASKYYNKGELVPDPITNEIVKQTLGELGMKDFILDGYPRNLNQARFLDRLVKLDALIKLEVTDEIIIERLSSRRICKNCGEVYNELFNPPEEEGVCDECGGELYQRDDDKPEVIRDRIESYEERSSPVLDFYEGKIPFVTLECEEADAPIDEMVDKIIEKMKEKDLIS